MNDQSTERLAALISQRCERLTQLRDVGRRQRELIAAGEISALLRLLSAKQQLIVALQAIERQLEPFHQQDPEQRRWESQAARTQSAAEAAQCAELLEEVMRIEQENERQMVARQREVAQQLKTINSAHRARDAYSTSAAASSSVGRLDTAQRDPTAVSAIDVST